MAEAITVSGPISGTDKTLTLAEDGSVAITAADLGFTDIDGKAPRPLLLTDV